MKSISRLTVLCFILSIILGNFTYAFGEETEAPETISFMDKKVPMYKYYFSEEYKNVHYKTLKDRGRKLALKREYAFIDSTIGLVSVTYAMVAFPVAFYELFMSYSRTEEGRTSTTKEDVFLIALIPAGFAILWPFLRTNPTRYRSGQEDLIYDFALPFIFNNYTIDIMFHISISACTGIFIEELIGYLNGDNSLLTGSSSNGFMIGATYGLITSIIGKKNLKEMDSDTTSRLELYPGMMLVNEIDPVMTMNLAYRF